jgi:hypothetical protein
MRQTTKRKIWGRGTIAQSLRAAIVGLNSALESVEKKDQPELLALQQIQKNINQAIEYYVIYGLNRKRLLIALEKEKKHISELLQKFIDLPITKDEKTIAKHKKGESIHGHTDGDNLKLKSEGSRKQSVKTSRGSQNNRNDSELESTRKHQRKAAKSRRNNVNIPGRANARHGNGKNRRKDKVGTTKPTGRKETGIR